MLEAKRASETVDGYTIRAWTGVATDEGVGLFSMVEVMDHKGVPVCRFDAFVADDVRRKDASWPVGEDASLGVLQEIALERARTAVLARALQEAHGHRFDL